MENNEKLLSSFQLITRYCKIESPYWRLFLEHYRNLGVSFFHICIQTKEDLDDFNLRFKDLFDNHIIHELDPRIPPNKALKFFNFKLLKTDLKYTIFVDADEFFSFSGLDNDLYECIDFFSQIRINWVMNIIENIYEDKQKGYFGHTGKPMALTKNLLSFRSDHIFRLKGRKRKILKSLIIYNQNPLKKFNSFINGSSNNITIQINAILIHYWARGIKDVILRSLFSRFKSFKQMDQSSFFEIVKSGSIPNRLKMMAYLSKQENYLSFDKQFNYEFYDKESEEQLLKSFGLSQILIDDIYENYYNYKNQLFKNKYLPGYPSQSIPTMQDLKNFI